MSNPDDHDITGFSPGKYHSPAHRWHEVSYGPTGEGGGAPHDKLSKIAPYFLQSGAFLRSCL